MVIRSLFSRICFISDTSLLAVGWSSSWLGTVAEMIVLPSPCNRVDPSSLPEWWQVGAGSEIGVRHEFDPAGRVSSRFEKLKSAGRP